MRYSRQRREALGKAFDFLNGRDSLRLLFSIGANEVMAGAALGRRIHPYSNQAIGSEALGALAGLALAAGQVSIGMGIWAVSKMSNILFTKMRRPKYYQRERDRRKRLARERRRIRDRFTTGTCPKPEELLKQYAKAGTGVREALRFGSMLCDLEAFCDNSLLRNVDGEIVGRNPGVKGWIRDNCPELLAHYKNAMRYKGLAEKFRQAAGAADPIPVAMLVAEDGRAAFKSFGRNKSCRITVRMKKVNGPRNGRTVSGTYALETDALNTAWKCASKILKECEGSSENRPRNGKTLGEGTAGDVKTKGIDRLLCGNSVDRPRCGKKDVGGSGVAKLERILDSKLGGLRPARFPTSKWRIVTATVRNSRERTIA